MSWEQRMSDKAQARQTEEARLAAERERVLRRARTEAEWSRQRREGPPDGCAECFTLGRDFPYEEWPRWWHRDPGGLPFTNIDDVCRHACHGDEGYFTGPIAIAASG